MKKLLGSVLIMSLSFSCFSKTSNTLCNGVTGGTFTTGDGSSANPYLICNLTQYARLSNETALLTKNFKLGADLNFTGQIVNIIGSNVTPFQADFNGDGYTLSQIALNIPSTRLNYFGVFGYLKNATIRNLIIDKLTMSAATTSYQHMGGVAGFATNSTISGVQVTNLNARAPSRSGGIIGYAVSTNLVNCGTTGSINGHAYASGLGGLIGRADTSNIFSSFSLINIGVISNSQATYVGSKVGGLFGYLVNTQVRDVYSQGSINFSNITNSQSSTGIGGLVGNLSGGSITNAYYAGVMKNILGTYVGGAIGLSDTTAITNVFWDQIISGQITSSGGVVSTTCLMKQKLFWSSNGFNTANWKLNDGVYPTLIWQAYVPGKARTKTETCGPL